MSNENEKKGLFGRLGGNKKTKNSCCCNIKIEEIPDEKEKNVDDTPSDHNCCC